MEQRLREERARIQTMGGSCCVLDIPYSGLTRPDVEPRLIEQAWQVLMTAIPQCLRASDTRGFHPHGDGISLMFLDTTQTAALIFLQRVREPLIRAGLDAILRSTQELMSHVRVYPETGSDYSAPMDLAPEELL